MESTPDLFQKLSPVEVHREDLLQLFDEWASHLQAGSAVSARLAFDAPSTDAGSDGQTMATVAWSWIDADGLQAQKYLGEQPLDP